MADTQVPRTLGASFKDAIWRLVRLAVAQIPFLITVLQGSENPKLVALGLFINAAMKFLRDMYPGLSWIPV